MRSIPGFFLPLLIAFFLFSCKDEEDTYLSLSVNSVEFPSEGASKDISIRTNTGWHISSATEWISFVPTSGSQDGDFTVVTTVNPDDTDREASFLVSAGKNEEIVHVKQKGTYLTLSESNLMFDREGTPQEIELVTNYSWTIKIHENAAWCTVEPMEGKGDQVLTLTPDLYDERIPRRDATIEVICNNHSYYILISQEIDNIAPTAPVLIYPADNADENGIYPFFQWSESSDADGDQVYYNVLVSKDQSLDIKEWMDLSGRITETEYLVSRKILEEKTDYYWQVVASDDFWGETYSEEIRQFKTGTNLIYADDTILVHTESEKGYPQLPRLVILGDGFVEEDFGKGNIFDGMSDIAIESFFALEPLTSYRDYFDIYKIVTYSEESGATVTKDFIDQDVKAQTRNTAFSSNLKGGDSPDIDCDTDLVFKYVQEKLELTEEELDNTTIILIINLDVYAGTTAMSMTGRSISMCPIGRDTFWEVVYHEAAGHGFGRLLDEYIYFPAVPLPENRKKTINDFRGDDIWSCAANLSLTDDESDVHWNHFIGRPGYNVSFYEGGFLYGTGIWRPEEYSCMDNNIPYFNAPSREAIVRRLMKITGQTFDYPTFYEEDIQKTYPGKARSYLLRSATNKKRLAPPVLLP